ncbi:MAG: 3-oxoacyl-ACP synthase [Bacteroidetes bacterium CHB5]|nr:3-oxoacyl-ACP synthase [Bacteroidetes bacterium CHB5]
MKVRKQLFDLCNAFADARISAAQEAMQQAQDAANDEEKSSAGDKYETGRAMAHLEKEKAAAQVAAGNKLKEVLNKINPTQLTTKATLGSIVYTNIGDFYLAISAGKLVVEGKEYLAVSPASPIGLQLMGSKVGSKITFQNKRVVILMVE